MRLFIPLEINKYFQQMKYQIREGTSILYDVQPLYLSLNLGQCGLHIHLNSSLNDFHLIRRRGVSIS